MTTRFCFPIGESRGFYFVSPTTSRGISGNYPCGTCKAVQLSRYDLVERRLNEIRRDTWSPADNGCRNIYGKRGPILINYPVTRVFVTRPVNTADLSSWANESDPFFLPQAENKPPPPPPPSPLVACTLLYYARNRIGREIPDER